MSMSMLTFKRVREILKSFHENPTPLSPSGYEALFLLMNIYIAHRVWDEELDAREHPEPQPLIRRRSLSAPPRLNSGNWSAGAANTDALDPSLRTPVRARRATQRLTDIIDDDWYDDDFDAIPFDVTWAPPRPRRWDVSIRFAARPRRLHLETPPAVPSLEAQDPSAPEHQLTQTTPTRPGRPHNFRFVMPEEENRAPARPRGIKRPNEDNLSTPKRRRDEDEDQ